jgi:cold shock protein
MALDHAMIRQLTSDLASDGVFGSHSGSKDVFVHISALERAGLHNLNEGQRVQFDITPGKDGRNSAENLKVIT